MTVPFINEYSSFFNAERESKLKKYTQITIPLLQRAAASNTMDEGNSVSLPETPSRTVLRAYLEQNWEVAPENAKNSSDLQPDFAFFHTVDDFTFAYIQYILRHSVAVLTGQMPDAGPTDINFSGVSRVFIYEIANSQPYTEPFLQRPSPPGGDITDKVSEISITSTSELGNSESRAAWCLSHSMYDIGSRNEFERFKKFIKGTLGERYWCLWIDIERLKVLKDPKRQKRYFLFLILANKSSKETVGAILR